MDECLVGWLVGCSVAESLWWSERKTSTVSLTGCPKAQSVSGVEVPSNLVCEV